MPPEDWAGGEKAEAKKKQAPASCIKCTRENAEAKLLCKRPTPKVKTEGGEEKCSERPQEINQQPSEDEEGASARKDRCEAKKEDRAVKLVSTTVATPRRALSRDQERPREVQQVPKNSRPQEMNQDLTKGGGRVHPQETQEQEISHPGGGVQANRMAAPEQPAGG